MFFEILTRPLYSKEIKSSDRQLQDDFSEFPPTPLRCKKILGDFSIFRVTRIGEIYIRFRILQNLTKISEEEFQNLSSEISEGRSYNDITSFHDSIRTLGFGSKRFESILIFAFILRVLVKELTNHKKNMSTHRAQGYFNPLLDNASQIVINSRFNDKKGDDHIVSHEHLHLLQFMNPEIHIRRARLPSNFFYENIRNDPHLLYIMEKKEFEARLHEVVISFYRAHRVLPLTVSGFLGVIAACEHLGTLVNPLLEINQTSFEKYEYFPARESRPVEHLEEVLVYIENLDMCFRFITEVMTVMYGNLLRYYGSEKDSYSYMQEIKRPNLYDELYGKNFAEGTGIV